MSKPDTGTAAKRVQAIVDRFDNAVAEERLSVTFIKSLEDEPFCRFEEWAESLTSVAECIVDVCEMLGEWRDAEGREDKADAKEAALSSLESFVTAWNESPLDLSLLRDWTEDKG